MHIPCKFQQNCLKKVLASLMGSVKMWFLPLFCTYDIYSQQVTQRMFNNAYHVLRLPTLTSKTRETAFQIMNRTIWTNNKAFKSRMKPTPNCDRCESTETMEHLLCECENYSVPLWTKLADSWTRLLNDNSLEPVPRVELGQTNVRYNIPHPSLILHIHDQVTRNALLLLIQEVKRDIVYRRMNLPPSAQQPTILEE
jgi:hypothetical protein